MGRKTQNHKTEDHKMEYQGFRSISEYERECARLSYKTRRVPFHDGNGGKFFALVTSCPGHPTGTSVEAWTLFTADETARVLDGIIDGLDVNYLGKLSAHGYYPDDPQDAPPPALIVPEYPEGEGGQICFQF